MSKQKPQHWKERERERKVGLGEGGRKQRRKGEKERGKERNRAWSVRDTKDWLQQKTQGQGVVRKIEEYEMKLERSAT